MTSEKCMCSTRMCQVAFQLYCIPLFKIKSLLCSCNTYVSSMSHCPQDAVNILDNLLDEKNDMSFEEISTQVCT